MNKTRYYTKKVDSKSDEACWFQSCPKDDRDASVDDGRFFINWKFGLDDGQTLGWKKQDMFIQGLIESAYTKAVGDNAFLNIGVQEPEGVSVLQVKIENEKGVLPNDGFGVANVLKGIDLSKEILFKLVRGKPYTTKYGMQHPWNIEISQNGSWVDWTFGWDKETKWFKNLPIVEKSVRNGKDIKDSSKRDAVMFDEIKDFCIRVDIECKGRKESREQTPAEAAVDTSHPSNVEEEDAPF